MGNCGNFAASLFSFESVALAAPILDNGRIIWAARAAYRKPTIART